VPDERGLEFKDAARVFVGATFEVAYCRGY
jgi:hypothetical protein